MKHHLKAWKADSVFLQLRLKERKDSAVSVENRSPRHDFWALQPLLDSFFRPVLKHFGIQFAPLFASSLLLLIIPRLAAQPLDLDVKSFQHITFKAIPRTAYENSPQSYLRAEVRESASFLLKGFEHAQSVGEVQVTWRSSGQLDQSISPGKLKTKQGDDAVLKVGLLLKGKPPMVPWFAPQWIKHVRDHLKVPTERMIWLVFGSSVLGVEEWPSPWNSQIKHRSVPSQVLEQNWHSGRAQFDEISVVGVAIMVDGDNSSSTFRTDVREILLK